VDVGLGRPISDPPGLLDWARKVDTGPFSTLALLDRLVYDNPEPLVTLAAVAGAARRIRVQTEVLLGPLRQPALMAKQVATLDRLSGGRLTLGIGLGARRDDYEVAGIDPHNRGARLDQIMKEMRRIEEARGNIHRYCSGPQYMDMPENYADMAVRMMLTTSGDIRDAINRLTDIGADEIIFYCWSPDTGQIDRFAETLT
jgi:hypothetical protein